MSYLTAVRSPQGTIEASVLVGGVPVPLWQQAGGRYFAQATPGLAYTLRVRNLLRVDVEVICTIDGRHVLDNEPGHPANCRGQVIRANDGYEFTGWRVSSSQVDEFLFGTPASSVAARATGSAENVGVVGFAVWRSREPYRRTYGDYDVPVAVASAGPASYTGSLAAEERTRGGTVGTGMGARRESQVVKVSFERAAVPDILAIGYDTQAELERRGIIQYEPNPFPAWGQTGYAHMSPNQ